MSQFFVAVCVLIVFFGLCWCAVEAEDQEKKQRRDELTRKRADRKARQQFEAEQKRKDLIARGKHIHQIPLSKYKPAAAYLAPAKPMPANVSTLRRKA